MFCQPFPFLLEQFVPPNEESVVEENSRKTVEFITVLWIFFPKPLPDFLLQLFVRQSPSKPLANPTIANFMSNVG